MDDARNTIEQAFERRSDLSPDTAPEALREAVEQVIAGLDDGSLRVAEPVTDGWQVNEWIKKAVLLYFPSASQSGHRRWIHPLL